MINNRADSYKKRIKARVKNMMYGKSAVKHAISIALDMTRAKKK